MGLFASNFTFNTILIKFSKWLILGLGICTIFLTAAWSYVGPYIGPYIGETVGRGELIQIVKATGNEVSSALTMRNTQILGRDKEQRLVEINAEQAKPSDSNFTHVGLEKPKAEIDMGEGQSLAVESSGGTFDREKNELTLEGDVKFSSTQGYDIQTSAAKVSLTENSFQTDTAVTGVGPTGTMEAEGMEVDQASRKITLKGKSKLVFDIKAIKSQSTDGSKKIGASETELNLGQISEKTR